MTRLTNIIYNVILNKSEKILPHTFSLKVKYLNTLKNFYLLLNNNYGSLISKNQSKILDLNLHPITIDLLTEIVNLILETEKSILS